MFILSLEKSDDIFLVIDLFSGFQPFNITILYRLFLLPIAFTFYTPYRHLHPTIYSRFYTLLSTLVTVNTTYTFHFFLLHHCTNSLSSLHIFVHHCTFCASLHVKTSPVCRCTCELIFLVYKLMLGFYWV